MDPNIHKPPNKSATGFVVQDHVCKIQIKQMFKFKAVETEATLMPNTKHDLNSAVLRSVLFPTD